jgi:hypothetical protein
VSNDVNPVCFVDGVAVDASLGVDPGSRVTDPVGVGEAIANDHV